MRATVVSLGLAAAVVASASISAQRGASQNPQADETPFVVGVTSWNGAIEILGRFDGSRWVNTWPDVEEPGKPVPRLADLPTAWLGMPVPREWHLWGRGGSSFPRLVTETRRGLVDAQGCTQPLVLAMDLPAGIPRRFFDGLIAVDTAREVEDVEDVRLDGPQGLQLEPIIRAAVMTSASAVFRDNLEWPGNTRTQVETAPIRIESLTRPARSDRSPFAFYFAATRRVEWDNSTIGVLVEGWIHAPGTGLWNAASASTSNVTARQFRGEEDPGSALKAQAIFRIGARAIWLMSAPGYEWVSFKFIEVTSTSAREVLTTSGGGC